MKDTIYVYQTDVFDTSKLILELTNHFISEFYFENKEHLPNEFQEILNNGIANDLFEKKYRRFLELKLIKDEIFQIGSRFHLLNEQLGINESISNQIPLTNLETRKHTIDPFKMIIEEENRTIINELDKITKPIIVVYTPSEQTRIFHLNSIGVRNDIENYLIEILESLFDDDLINSHFGYFDEPSLKVLEDLSISIEGKVNELNENKITKEIADHLEEFWFLKYKVEYSITNLEKILQEQDLENQLTFYDNLKLKDDAIVFYFDSDEGISGIQVNPNDELVKDSLKNKCLEIFTLYLGDENENNLLHRINELANGDFELTIIDFSFPEKN